MTEKISGSGQNVTFVPVFLAVPTALIGATGPPLLVGLLPDLALAPDLDLEALGERVDDRDADAVQAAGDLVGVVVELSARVQVRHDDLERLALVLLVHPDRDAAAVVLDRDGVVGVDRDGDVVA